MEDLNSVLLEYLLKKKQQIFCLKWCTKEIKRVCVITGGAAL